MSAVDSSSPELYAMADGRDLGSLFREHARYVAGVAYRLLGNDAEIDDVVQDVFLEAGPALGSIREPAAIRGWLATIAVRVSSRRLRRRRLRRWLPWHETPAVDLKSDGVSAEDRVLLANVYRVLDRVATAERVAWSLRYVEGVALEEVARLCECSLATAKRRIAAAQAQIHKELGDG